MELSVIIDIVTVLILIIYMYRSYLLGFAKSLILFLGNIASLIISYFLGKMLALSAYNVFISKEIEKIANSVATTISTETAPTYILDAILEHLPTSLEETALAYLGGRENAISFITEHTSNTYTPVNDLVINVLKSLSVFLLQAVFCMILFVVCSFIVKIVAKIVGGIFKLPIVGPINSILGAVLGLLQAVIILCICGFIVNAGVMYFSNETSTINDSLFQSTYIFKHFYNILANISLIEY